MIKYNNILVGVQFCDSEPSAKALLTSDSQEAVDCAMLLAESQGSRLTFVTSFETHPPSMSEIKAAQSDEDTLLPAVRREMDELVNSAIAKDVDAAWEFLFGTAWRQLCNKVHADNHDLLIVGNRKRSGFARALLGSTAKRVSHFAPCPVCVVQHQERRRRDTVVIATDLSEIGEAVLRHGLSWGSWNKSEVHIVHAVPNWFLGRWYRAGYAKDAIMQQHEEKKMEARQNLGEQISKVMEEMCLGSTPHVHVKTGSPEDVIWRAVDDHDANLAVMGVVGRTGMQRYLVGDTAEKLLPELPCTLLTVKPEDFAYGLD